MANKDGDKSRKRPLIMKVYFMMKKFSSSFAGFSSGRGSGGWKMGVGKFPNCDNVLRNQF
jgi:hypothetical protein